MVAVVLSTWISVTAGSCADEITHLDGGYDTSDELEELHVSLRRVGAI